MKNKKAEINKRLAKQSYIIGKNITEIATALKITRNTVYNYKNADFKVGIDWDELRFVKSADTKDLEKKEKEFIYTLIKNFEDALEEVQKIEDSETKLNMLTRYVNTYYKIKMNNKEDCKVQKAKIATDTVFAISEIALKQDNISAVDFLSQNADLIIQAII